LGKGKKNGWGHQGDGIPKGTRHRIFLPGGKIGLLFCVDIEDGQGRSLSQGRGKTKSRSEKIHVAKGGKCPHSGGEGTGEKVNVQGVVPEDATTRGSTKKKNITRRKFDSNNGNRGVQG